MLKGKQSVISLLSDMMSGIIEFLKVLRNILFAYFILYSTVLYVFEHLCGLSFAKTAFGIADW